MQTQPASAQLGRTAEGKSIGYRVLTVGRAEYRPFTTDGVTLTGTPYHYAVVGGIEAPDNGGFVIWGTADQDMAEAPIPATHDIAPLLTAFRADMEALAQRLAAMIPPPPALAEMAEAINENAVRIAAELRTQLVDSQEATRGQLAALGETLTMIRETADNLTILNDGAHQIAVLAEMRNRLNNILGEGPHLPIVEVDLKPVTGAIAQLNQDVVEIARRVDDGKKHDDVRLRTVASLDKFLSAVGGTE